MREEGGRGDKAKRKVLTFIKQMKYNNKGGGNMEVTEEAKLDMKQKQSKGPLFLRTQKGKLF